jgi:hypothetical protein
MNNEEDNDNKVVEEKHFVTPTISELMADNIKYKINNEILRQKLTKLQKNIDELKKEVANLKKFQSK